MSRFLALFLCLLLLLQTFSRELLVVDYQLHKERITRLFCVNKARPMLHCNGRCHLVKELRRATDAEGKSPAAAFAKLKLDVLLPLACVLPAPLATYPQSVRFAAPPASGCATGIAAGVFHPPALIV